ncbi:1,5-anhydro-D-fructose reductase [Orchesella cincta]|uniref:1,5-anhydro-D-fructose reductase n=1 Tax=Orchesella cincta TaxID=48709 RepID=A0A1D2MT34_ORCCI|nr:1,5-anhydro-D-fructose reductase [Orchesella cincta]
MSIKLSNGHNMPLVGLGCSVFPEPPSVVEKAVETALDIGYKHFDTATLYNTELHLGNALRKAFDAGKVKREDLFIVTKLPQNAMAPERVSQFMDKALRDLQLQYVDLYLVHWPVGMLYRGNEKEMVPVDGDGNYLYDANTDLEAIWKEMEKLVESGRAKSIGVSNFNEKQLERILKIAKIPPVNNQVELHAYLQQPQLREFCNKHGISLTAYYPLGGLSRKDYPAKLKITVAPKLLEDPVVLDLAKKYNRSPAQILLRFSTQLDVAVIPKSSNPSRQLENFQIMDFTLKNEDLELLKSLDQGESARSCFSWPGAEKHPEYPFGHARFVPPPAE